MTLNSIETASDQCEVRNCLNEATGYMTLPKTRLRVCGRCAEELRALVE